MPKILVREFPKTVQAFLHGEASLPHGEEQASQGFFLHGFTSPGS
jgi:hypothetical protein